MSTERLRTVRKVAQIQEEALVRDCQAVERILFDRLVEERIVEREIERGVLQVRRIKQGCVSAAVDGDISRVLSQRAYEKRVDRELGKLKRIHQEKQEGVARAQERVENLRQEALDAQIEGKRVEKLLDRLTQAAHLQLEAHREVVQDELSRGHRGRISLGKSFIGQRTGEITRMDTRRRGGRYE